MLLLIKVSAHLKNEKFYLIIFNFNATVDSRLMNSQLNVFFFLFSVINCNLLKNEYFIINETFDIL